MNSGRWLWLAGIPPWLARSTVRVTAWNAILVGAITATKSTTNALFLSRAEPRALPFLYVAVAVVVALVTATLSRTMGRHAPQKVLSRAVLVSFVLYVVLVGAVLLDVPRATGALYVLGEVSATSLSILLWARISDAFSPRNLRRVVGVISAGGMAGAVVGGLFISAVVETTGAALPIVGVNLAVLLTLPLLYGLRSVSRRQTYDRPSSSQNAISYLVRDRFALSVAALVVLFAGTGAAVDFVFRLASAAERSESAMAGLFGLLNAAVGVGVVVVQLGLTSALLARLGLFAFTALVPLLLFAIALAYAIAPSFALLLVLKGVEMAGAFSLYNAAITLLYNPLPGELRSQLRTLIDGAVKKGGAALAGLGLGALAYVGGANIGTGSVIVVSALTLALVPRIRRLYLRALEEQLGRRRRRGESVAIDLSDGATAQVLLGALDSGDPDRVLAALDALGEGYALAREHLVGLLGHRDERVRVAALRHVAHAPDPMLTSWLRGVIHDERARRPRSEAIRALQWTAGKDAAKLVERFLHDEDPGAVTAAIEVALVHDVEGPFRERLDQLVESLPRATPAVRREVARLLGRLGEARYDSALVALIHDPEPTVRRLAIEAAGRERHVVLLEELIAALGDRTMRASAHEALVAFGDLAVGALSTALDDKKRTLQVRIHIPRVLASIDSEDAARALIYSNPRDDAYLQRRIADRLMEIVQRHPTFQVGRERTDDAIRRRLKSYAAYQKAELELSTLPDDVVRVLRKFAAERRDLHLRIALQLLGMHHGIDRMMSVYRGLSASRAEGDERRHAAIELLDVALTGDPMRDELLELLDKPPVPVTEDAGHDRVRLLSRSKDPLMRAVARRAARELFGPVQGDILDGPSLRAIAAGAEELEGDDMREELVERLLFLENVDLFEGLHADDLAAIAGLCTEEDFAAGAVVYREGDPGDCLYVIVSGEVDITKNGERILSLSPGESLGQVSFLDQGARPVSAVVSARARTRLLRIERGAFLDLLSDRPGLMHAFFAVLARRLRVLIDRGANETSM